MQHTPRPATPMATGVVALRYPLYTLGMDIAGANHDSMTLPVGSRLLHIGPHKTGTTALQNTLIWDREKLPAQGLEYLVAGDRRNANFAARAIRQRPTQKLESPDSVPMHLWTGLVQAAKNTTLDRVLISGEGFSDCNPMEIARIAQDLDPTKLHIAVTLRPLAKILTSQWQQYIQNNMKRASLDRFLHETLDPEPQSTESGFWRRHRHDQLVKRWADPIGAQNLTVIVVDDREPKLIMRAFERLTGLREGTLTPNRNPINRSLTLAEAEIVRAYYTLMEEQGYNPRVYRKGVSIRPALFLKEQRNPGPEEEKIQLPEWAAERTREISRTIVDGIKSSGVRVIGDLEGLTRASASSGAQQVHIPAELAAHLTVGMLVKSGLARKKSAPMPIPARSTMKKVAERISASSSIGNFVIAVVRRMLRRFI
jgi:hypothetical protein